MFVFLFTESSKPGVNKCEENPFCYLITAYASMCNVYLRFQDQESAFSCLEKATDTAIELYKWGRNCHADLLAMEDIRYFVMNTLYWCYNKAPENIAEDFSECSRYVTCKKRIDAIIS